MFKCSTLFKIQISNSDYFNDVHTFLEPSMAARVAERAAADTVARYAAALAAAPPARSPAVLERMAADEAALGALFEALGVPKEGALRRAAQMADLRELLAAKVRAVLGLGGGGIRSGRGCGAAPRWAWRRGRAVRCIAL